MLGGLSGAGVVVGAADVGGVVSVGGVVGDSVFCGVLEIHRENIINNDISAQIFMDDI